MAVYIRSGCSASHKATFERGCHEVQIIKVCGKHNNFYLFSVYRNSDADDGIFDCLLVSMAAIQENDREASSVFIGDFNAHHKEWLNFISQTDCHGLRALDFSSESGCDQIIRNPTHRLGNCLDLIFTDTSGVVAGNVGCPIGTSDHSYVSAIIKAEHAVPDISFSCKIYFKSQADWDGILNDLRELDYPDIYKQVDFVASMNDGFERVIVRRIPFRVIKFRIKDKAWFNEDCKRANLAKQEAYQLWRRNCSDITWNNYVSLRNAAQETYAAAEKEYNDGVRDTLIGTTNSHKWWSTLKTALFGVDVVVPPILRPDRSLAHCSKEKAALFADVFDSKQSNDSLNMPQSCFPEAELTAFAFYSGEVKKLLLELDSYGCAGPDGIFPLFFIKTAIYLAPKISTVLCKLVRIGGFSMCWRVGNISPVPKSGSANSCPSGYRPITITPVLSKVFERLLAKRLNNFAEKKNLFPHLQFGFRKGLGTCDALLTITNFVQKALDCGCQVRMVGLDHSAAFDRVNHKTLIFKLRQLGVGGPFLSILTEFSSNRLQRVVVDGQFNDYRNDISDVPQGSVLGPLLFILYTHDMWFALEKMLASYADDATLLAHIPSPNMRSDVTESLNRDLSMISTWCNLWGMRLNPNKTQSVIVNSSRTLFPPNPDLLVGSTSLYSCEFSKILGVMFDSKLTFESHIHSISSSVAQKIGLLRKSFRIFGDHDAFLRCFNSFILPCLEYHSPLWSSAADSHLKLIDKNLRACKFLIPNLAISLQHRRFISSMYTLYKIFHNLSHPLHSEIPNLFHPRRVTKGSLSINSLSFSPMRFHTSQYSRCFIPAATKLWNELPSMIVGATELQKFKTGANAFLLGVDGL